MNLKTLIFAAAVAVSAPAQAAVSVHDVFSQSRHGQSVEIHDGTQAVLWWIGVLIALDEGNALLEAKPVPPFSFRLLAAYNRNIAEVVGGIAGRDNYGAYVQFMGRADLFEMFADFIGEPEL